MGTIPTHRETLAQLLHRVATDSRDVGHPITFDQLAAAARTAGWQRRPHTSGPIPTTVAPPMERLIRQAYLDQIDAAGGPVSWPDWAAIAAHVEKYGWYCTAKYRTTPAQRARETQQQRARRARRRAEAAQLQQTG